MAENWSLQEVEAAVADYFEMLAKELRDQPFNKADHNRQLQRYLTKRTRGSIERKHQNISAVLLESGYPYVEGYKPLSNYQQLLREIVETRLSALADLSEMVSSLVTSPMVAPPMVTDILSIQVEPPSGGEVSTTVYESEIPPRPMPRRDYLAIEAKNQSLGRAGEQFILRFEHERLWRAGQKHLAERIDHVSNSKGDYLGYDILSFETDGQERLIEVKTTQFGPMTPFFASKNEVTFSAAAETKYQLYRLFGFRKQPQLFVLPGSLRRSCIMDPVLFSAIPA